MTALVILSPLCAIIVALCVVIVWPPLMAARQVRRERRALHELERWYKL